MQENPLTVHVPLDINPSHCANCDHVFAACVPMQGAADCSYGTLIFLDVPDHCIFCGASLTDAPPVLTPTPPTDVIDYLPWNDNSPWPFPKSDISRKRWVTLHHSAGERATTNIGYWNRLHTVNKNWPHIGYHFGIAALVSGGEIGCYQTNEIGTFSWHDSRNHDTIGVCIAGDLRAGHDNAPTPDQVRLTGELLAWLVPQLPNFQGVIVHKSIQATACPGDVERWGYEIVDAAATFGLDLEGRFDVPLPRTRLARMRGLFVKSPPADSYGGV